MKCSRLVSMVSILSLAVGIACAQTVPAPATAPATAPVINFDAPPPIRPAIQQGNNSPQAHEQLVTKAKIGAGKIDVYFEGDSIARRWGPNDAAYAKYLKNWNENFFGWNAADFGWGADSVQNILWRLENGELDGVNPKVIVFLGGTNNLNAGQGDRNVNDITGEIRACVGVMRKKAPDAVIVLTGIFPRTPAADLPIINKINDNLSKMADGKKIRYININDKIMDKNGNLVPGMLNGDNLHPDTKGYQAWADAIKPILTEVLGRPAKEDHAPPPTGDPKTNPVYPPPGTATAPAPAGRG